MESSITRFMSPCLAPSKACPTAIGSPATILENIIIENGGTVYSLNEYVRISDDYFYNCNHSPCFEFYLNNAKYLKRI